LVRLRIAMRLLAKSLIAATAVASLARADGDTFHQCTKEETAAFTNTKDGSLPEIPLHFTKDGKEGTPLLTRQNLKDVYNAPTQPSARWWRRGHDGLLISLDIKDFDGSAPEQLGAPPTVDGSGSVLADDLKTRAALYRAFKHPAFGYLYPTEAYVGRAGAKTIACAYAFDGFTLGRTTDGKEIAKDSSNFYRCGQLITQGAEPKSCPKGTGAHASDMCWDDLGQPTKSPPDTIECGAGSLCRNKALQQMLDAKTWPATQLNDVPADNEMVLLPYVQDPIAIEEALCTFARNRQAPPAGLVFMFDSAHDLLAGYAEFKQKYLAPMLKAYSAKFDTNMAQVLLVDSHAFDSAASKGGYSFEELFPAGPMPLNQLQAHMDQTYGRPRAAIYDNSKVQDMEIVV